MRFKMINEEPNWPAEEEYLTAKLKNELAKLHVDQEKIRELTNRIREAVYKQREEILRAFIAQYGCMPDEAVQCEQATEKGYRWYVRKKTPEEMASGIITE